jgi:hypothetical protein
MRGGLALEARDQIVERAVEHRLPGLDRRGADVEKHYDVGHGEQRLVGRGRLPLEHVERRAGQTSRGQRLGQCLAFSSTTGPRAVLIR